MELALKLIISQLLLILCTCFIGMATIGNNKIQKTLTFSVYMQVILILLTVIATIWSI